MPYRWGQVEGAVRVEIGTIDHPEEFGCSEIARGFPYCHATVEHAALGYKDVLGWVQLVDSSLHHDKDGFFIDHFQPLDSVYPPLSFYGWAPTFFDAPHSDEGDWDFLAHTFLCGLGGEVLEFRREVRAILGFSWGFSKREGVESFGPAPLSPQDWDRHRDYLVRRFPKGGWKFAPGFAQDPLHP
ncbi:MAG: hypothetical protein M3Y75_12835 [Actinomycetota bacterium]|nr:hypothetical protein [Actinomycetota bacterium]